MVVAKPPHPLERVFFSGPAFRNRTLIRVVNLRSPTPRMNLLRRAGSSYGGGLGWSLVARRSEEPTLFPESSVEVTSEAEHLIVMVNGINGRETYFLTHIEVKQWLYSCMERLLDEDQMYLTVHNQPNEYTYKGGMFSFKGVPGTYKTDWSYAAKQLKKLDKVLVHCSECNSSTLTFDGVDVMGLRLAEEVESIVKKYHSLDKISFVAHSLGGLIARYAIGKLYSDASDTNGCGRVAGLEPMNFVTVATPHLGSRGNRQLPFLCGLSFLEKRASQTAHFIVGKSGKHLFLTDNDMGEAPLLLRMVNDSDDLKFMSALRVFKRRVAYANANYDHLVGWRTASIRRQSELPKPNLLEPINGYQHVVSVKQKHPVDRIDKCRSHIEDVQDELEEKMIRGLTQVHWERVDVSFQKSRQRFIAHNTIQVKRYWLHSDGADVINHVKDHFLQ